jgi:hypothetical protein
MRLRSRLSEDQTPRHRVPIMLQTCGMIVGPLDRWSYDDGTMFHILQAIDHGWSCMQPGHVRLPLPHHTESCRDNL